MSTPTPVLAAHLGDPVMYETLFKNRTPHLKQNNTVIKRMNPIKYSIHLLIHTWLVYSSNMIIHLDHIITYCTQLS